jgi:hypothetical protein
MKRRATRGGPASAATSGLADFSPAVKYSEFTAKIIAEVE